MKKNFITLFIIILAISCSNKSNDIATEFKTYKIRVGYMPDFSGTSAVAIASEKGFFKEENLDVTLLQFLDGPSEINAMLSNNLDFAYIGHGAHSLAVEGKVNVLFPNALSKSEQIIVRNDANINELKDLKGKRVGTQFGTSSEILLNLALQSLGILREEVNIVDMDGNNIVSAITDKKVDAVSVQVPYSFEILKNLGQEVKSIATTMDYSNVGTFPSSWVVTPEYQTNNNEAVIRFSRAILKAMDYRAENIDESIEIVAKKNDKPVETINLEKDTGVWLSGADVRNAYIDGTAANWYKLQQNIFIYTKSITNSVDINNYVQIKYIVDNIFNK